jgi:hypothetical protein
MMTPDQEANRYLLPCLKLLFPECVIESFPGKVIKEMDISVQDDNVRILQIKKANDGPYKELDA